MNNSSDSIDKAIDRLWQRRSFRFGDCDLEVACLIRKSDWRPLKAPWWRKKEACIIGVDLNGNFFLRHCDGSVRYWDHQAQADSIIADSVREFLGNLLNAPPGDAQRSRPGS